MPLREATAGMNSQHRDMHMRKLLLTTAALVALTAGQGFGADLQRPVMKVPPAPLPVASWTGCYVGAGGGYGMANVKLSAFRDTDAFVFDTGHDNSAHGFLGTVRCSGRV